MSLPAIRNSLFFFLLIANSVFAQVNLNQGLKAYYPFTGNANDVSGNNNNPVFNNAALTTDRFGNPNSAYHFNGSSSYMQILNSPSVNSTNKISLVAWVRPMGFYTGTCHGNSVIMKGDADYLTGNYLMRFDDNAYTNGTNCGGGPVDVLHQNFYGGTMAPPPGYTPYIQVNQWYSVIITMDGTTAKLYIDCQLKASGPQGGQTFTNAYDLYFGKLNNPSFPYWFNGDLDEVRIYDRDLTVDEVNVLGSCNTGFTCTNWLRTQAVGQSVTVGDLDVSGNQVTIEANFNCSSFPTTRPDKQEDIVSKHSNTTDINYVLRMDLAGITTTNGQFLTPFPCDNLVTNKTYHVALVYNGTTLKFYRNGFLMSQIAATGNLVLNNWLTTIGDYAVNNPVGTNFLGYINEVRIWNVARTQAQLQAYMNISLPNPTTQPGLLGYYTFDNLLNKQGNAAYNGTLNGAATINNTNPNCSFLADSCPVTTVISNIINTYTPVLALSPCDNKLTVTDASTFNTGDTVLMIQMKGAVIDSTNTAAFGTIIDYKNAGNYEFNYVKSKTGNVIELKNKLTRQYDIPVGKVQLIRVPYYSTALVSATLTCPPWDGSKGGVLVLNARDSVKLNADIDLSGKGFRGGQTLTNIPGTGNYNQTDYAYPANLVEGARKGEGIAEVSESLIFCRGPLYSGGGGANSHNAGGGGGGNGGAGGRGGNEWGGSATVLTNGGVGGKNHLYTNNRIFVGSGGGAGHNNDATGTSGGNGGGLAIILTNTIQPNANRIISNGLQGIDCVNLATCADGVGGGGSGGTVIINAQTITSNFQVQTNGGKGADNNINGPNATGPGGGGGGGALLVNSAVVLGGITYSTTGGVAGRAFHQGNTNWGALNGNNGISLSNFIIPASTVPFTPNIDSVRIKDSIISCLNVDFKGFAYTNTNPVNTWQWYFGDGGTANTQNTGHSYTAPGTYIVKLVVTDINGCQDSVLKVVTLNICTGISNIINTYTPVLAFDPCDNRLTVEDAITFNTGDTVLIIQMKGAVIDSTNTVAFGTITDYKNAGNYEFNYVNSKVGNVIELKNKLLRQYDIPIGKVQLIRVPYYNGNVNVIASLTSLPWDGSKGGVVVLNVLDTITLNADIDVNGMGFRGGQAITTSTGLGIYNQTDYAYPANPNYGARKGEGIAQVSENLIFCRGPLASGGGGGNSHNSGGGGGGNGGSGGKGGNEWAGAATILPVGGVGGKNLIGAIPNKIFMGGGGGAGHGDNGTASPGGNGGGIVIINSGFIKPNSFKIISNGIQGTDCTNLGTCADGVGGGGAGGTILLNTQTILSNIPIQANGGKGADNNIPGPNVHGTGGGGAGGNLFVNNAALLGSITYSSTGGAAGRALNHGNTNWGAAIGGSGISASGVTIPFSTVPFTHNIDSVRIKDSLLSCNGFDFKGLAYTNTNPISTWQWYFGDGGTANTQNTTYAYSVAGTYTVKLIVTDINGCVDSVSKDVTALPGIVANAGNDTAFCSNSAVSHTLQGTGAGTYSWTPAVYLNNPTIQNPVATVSTTTTFYLTVTGASACSSIDSVTIYVNPVPLVQTLADTSICANDILVLTTTAGLTTYHWAPGTSVSDSTIASPVFTGNGPVTLVVTGTNASGCFARDTILVNVKPLPLVRSIADSAICSTSATITLTTTGAQTYSWTPTIFLSNPNIANPVFTGNQSQTYYVTGTAANGCKAKDTVNIYVTAPFPLLAPPDKSMCQNNSVQLDGYNGTAVQYLWSPATYLSNPTIINPIANPPATITYAVKITNQGCNYDSTFNVVVTVLPKLPVTAGKLNDIDCANRTAQLFASGGTTYTWMPATGLSNPNIPNPVATPATNQTYIVNVSDANGCSNIDSVTVLVNRMASLARYMPNTFTPNGDGLNDCYGLKNWMYIKKLEFRIFNRYGEQVFATADPSRCWDGRYKGKIADQGSYVFYIKAETNCGTEEQKGSFMLLR